jgi:hypothetical protein
MLGLGSNCVFIYINVHFSHVTDIPSEKCYCPYTYGRHVSAALNGTEKIMFCLCCTVS